MLGQEAEQGGVHRMLGICSEFVRISKVVIERAEREQSSRRKRKTADGGSKTNTPTSSSGKVSATNQLFNDTSSSETPRPTTFTTLAPTPRNLSVFSTPGDAIATTTSPGGSFTPSALNSLNTQSPSGVSSSWQQDLPPAQNGDFDSYNNLNAFGAIGVSPPPVPLTARPFAQPLLPQDLFSLPATLDWSWAEMSGGAYPSVENGNYTAAQQDMSEQDG